MVLNPLIPNYHLGEKGSPGEIPPGYNSPIPVVPDLDIFETASAVKGADKML